MRFPRKQVFPEKHRQHYRDTRFALRLSLSVGILMLAGKMTAYLLTGSSAIFSDAAESVVHVVVVAFAAFSLWLSAGRPRRSSSTDTRESHSSPRALKAP